MKAAFVSTFLALFFAFVAAQTASPSAPFYITSPLQGDSFKAGSTLELKWLNGVAGAAKVSLLTGTNAQTMKPTGVSFSIEGSDSEYDWTVPSSLPQNATFSLQISYTDPTSKSAATVYSAPFTLSGTTGDVVTQSFVTGASSVIASASSVISSAAPSSSILVTSISRPAASSSAASSSISASASPTQPASAAAGFKAPTIAVCVVALIASALFL